METKKVYDEIVLDQEAQIVPAFILEFEPRSLSEPAMKFTRDVVEAPSEKNRGVEARPTPEAKAREPAKEGVVERSASRAKEGGRVSQHEMESVSSTSSSV